MMTNQNKNIKVMQLLTLLSKSYPHSKADGSTLALYVKALEPLSYAQIEAGVTKCMRKCKFFPTVAEIFESAESMTMTANNTGKPEAGEAWQEAMDNVRKYSCYKPWQYSCDEVKQAVKQFGKMDLIMLESDAVNTARAQFMRIYNAIVNRQAEKEENQKVFAQLGNRKVQELINSAANKLALVSREGA